MDLADKAWDGKWPQDAASEIAERPVLAAIGVYGIWLRTIGDDVQVLAEVAPGEWRLVIEELRDGNVSHIVEPAGIEKAPIDEVTRS